MSVMHEKENLKTPICPVDYLVLFIFKITMFVITYFKTLKYFPYAYGEVFKENIIALSWYSNKILVRGYYYFFIYKDLFKIKLRVFL